MKLNWGTGIAITYILFATGIIVLVIIASKQKNDLVTDQYYDAAVNYEKTIQANTNFSMADSKLVLAFSEDNSSVFLSTTGKATGISGSLSFYKPDNADADFKVNFKTDVSGNKVIHLKKLNHGLWKVTAFWTNNGLNYSKEENVFIK